MRMTFKEWVCDPNQTFPIYLPQPDTIRTRNFFYSVSQPTLTHEFSNALVFTNLNELKLYLKITPYYINPNNPFGGTQIYNPEEYKVTLLDQYARFSDESILFSLYANNKLSNPEKYEIAISTFEIVNFCSSFEIGNNEYINNSSPQWLIETAKQNLKKMSVSSKLFHSDADLAYIMRCINKPNRDKIIKEFFNIMLTFENKDDVFTTLDYFNSNKDHLDDVISYIPYFIEINKDILSDEDRVFFALKYGHT